MARPRWSSSPALRGSGNAFLAGSWSRPFLHHRASVQASARSARRLAPGTNAPATLLEPCPWNRRPFRSPTMEGMKRAPRLRHHQACLHWNRKVRREAACPRRHRRPRGPRRRGMRLRPPFRRRLPGSLCSRPRRHQQACQHPAPCVASRQRPCWMGPNAPPRLPGRSLLEMRKFYGIWSRLAHCGCSPATNLQVMWSNRPGHAHGRSWPGQAE